MAKFIDRAIAKQELERINKVLSTPHLLIGGLAVQQYVPTRNSQDIDLVCQFDTLNEILDTLYPDNDWDMFDATGDEYRPSFRINHRYEERGTIIFGPKLLEREAYKFIDWEELMSEGHKFRHKDTELENIIVPSSHALAYTKIISFIGRAVTSEEKIKKDLKDFISLTNHKDFSLHKFYDLFRKTGNAEELMAEFKTRFSVYKDQAKTSCLYYLSNLFGDSNDKPSHNKITAYLAGPHKNIDKNNRVASYLSANGINTKVPYNETTKKKLVEKDSDAKQIKEVCVNAIKESNFVIVDLDTYGLDTAWEIGFADGLRKTVIGYNEDVELATETRRFQRRDYLLNFMHGWQDQIVFDTIEATANHCEGKRIYVAGSFANPEIDKVSGSLIEQKSSNFIFPKNLVEANKLMPKGYPFSSRRENIRLMQESDIILVVLPRYGMDVSWQIGFASAIDKEIIGIKLEDDRNDSGFQAFWDHWMHGWKEKIRVTNFRQLTAMVKGIIETSA